jgi:superfamily II DNA or RNA helicase
MASNPQRPHITPALLRELGDWRAEKEGRTLAATGHVLHWQFDPPMLHGTVRTSGGSTVQARIKLGDRAVDVQNLCSCRQARTDGTICAHVMALVFASTTTTPAPASPPKPAPPPTFPEPTQSLAPRIRWTSLDEANDHDPRLSLMIILPVDLPRAWKTGSIRVILEAIIDNQPSRPFDAISADTAYAVGDIDARVLQQFPNAGMWMLASANYDTFFTTLIGHPNVWLGKKQRIDLHRADEQPMLRLNLDPTGNLHLHLDAASNPELDNWTFDGKRLTRCVKLPAGYPPGDHLLSRAEFVRFYQHELPALQSQVTTELSAEFDRLEFIEKPPLIRIVLDGGLAGLNLELKSSPRTDWTPDPDHPFRYWRHARFDPSIVTDAGFEPRNQPFQYRLATETHVGHFLANVLPRWEQQWTIEYGPQFASFLKRCDRVEPDITLAGTDNNWLGVDVAYKDTSGAQVLSAADVQRLLQKGASHHRHASGRVTLVPSAAIEQFQDVIRDCDATQTQGVMRVKRQHAPYIAEALKDLPMRARWQAPVNLQTARPVTLTEPLASLLRPYQRDGVQWLQFLSDNNMAGILADEMGLGKTLQALAWLDMLRVAGKPSLVVCPTSLLANWESEATRFLPGIKTLVLHGADRHDSFAQAAQHDLVITSYALLRRDADRHQSIEWQAVVLDEAQQIKNRFSQNAQTVKSLRAAHRLVLTGTPMENALGDLWSICDFLMPGYLGSAKEFRDRYETPIVKQRDTAALQRLRHRLRPIVLRRTKSEVARDLPSKIDQITWCDMTDEQQSLYRTILDTGRREVFEHAGKGGESHRRMAVLATLLRLRQASCHLGLLPGTTSWTAPSAKLETCLELIDEAVSSGHRILVFSQFVKFLRLAETALNEQTMSYCFLDGSTVDRDGEIRRFRKSDIPVFLISLKAGGTGLNLTEADTVIHLDPWWNPAVEDQATARAHRIGQRNVVTSYKLIAKGTVEEKIVKLQETKRDLISRAVTTDESFVHHLTLTELEDLLR